MSTSIESMYHPYECEIIIPVTLKIVILLQPEVLEMPSVCHPQVLELESDAISTSTQGDEERFQASVNADAKQNSYIVATTESKAVMEVEKTLKEADWLVVAKEQIWRYLPEGLKLFISQTFPDTREAS
ncbi:MAG TPA: hypothetical protein DCP31_13480 [Cyanobacteria bacterium UBA8543]|nr:hypothetical protein [Cyanobacteria bacterium UBA8543]